MDAELAFVNAWLRANHLPIFDPTYDGTVGASIMFRKLGEPGDTVHWLNWAAVYLTSWPWEDARTGNNCHAEMLIEIQKDCVLRCATMYLREQVDDHGNKTYHPGKSFVIPINNFQYYDSMRLDADRRAQLHMLRVAIQNVGMPFNVLGYRIKALSPWAPGTAAYDPEAHRDFNAVQPVGSAHCTQLATILAQALAHAAISAGIDYPSDHWASACRRLRAPDQTPNSLFKLLNRSRGCRYTPSIRVKKLTLGQVDE